MADLSIWIADPSANRDAITWFEGCVEDCFLPLHFYDTCLQQFDCSLHVLDRTMPDAYFKRAIATPFGGLEVFVVLPPQFSTGASKKPL